MIYAVGDVHGEAEALRELLAKLPVQASDLVIFLGDAINRGPDSFDCIEQIIAFNGCPKIFIQGNHEEAMLLFLEESDIATLIGLSGQATLDSYARAGYALMPGDTNSLPPAHLHLYAQRHPWTLPFYITGQYIFTHAGWDTLPCRSKCSLPAHCAGAKSRARDSRGGSRLSCAATRRFPASCLPRPSSMSAWTPDVEWAGC